jgi:N,N'-diacetyllegionaminate synthase
VTRIIADCCCNHMGDRRIMEAMIKAAAGAGVDIVKFQSFRANKLRRDYPNYEQERAYYAAHELSMMDHSWLMDKCKEYGVEFLTTVFDVDTVDFLADLGLKQVKIASPDCNNWALIDKCLKRFKRLIVSTGLHTEEEIKKAYFKYAGVDVAWLKCVSKYPAELSDLHMGDRLLYGLSDHTLGTDAAKLAISLGADYVEKHFTLNRNLPGKDQAFAGTVEEFKEICQWRNKVKAMMGSGVRELTEQELENRKKYIGRWSGA